MPPPRGNGVLQRKLALLSDQLLKLKSHLREVTREEFRESWALRSMTERALQVAIEIMIDISERIIAIENAGPAATAGEALVALVRLQVLRDVQPYRDMIRFRNLLVCQYAEINPDLLYEIATEKLEDFRAFRNEIDLWTSNL
jgi:uncharacterized protein YutE (UPF0331/DUF86 family)